MSWNETECPKCGVRIKTCVRGMGVPGGQEREEGFCPFCGELVISEMTDGFVYVELVTTGGFTITSPSGKPMEETPGGKSLAGITFKSEDTARKFIARYWSDPVLVKEFPRK